MDLLRFATAGSVDDGKSTLIGRLLFDTSSIADDQLEAVERASMRRGEKTLNLALFTDGLRAEREQGITIDVAYRYFSSSIRKYILSDSPGHTQYTRNMVTAISGVDVVVLILDARHGLVEQSRRHACLAHLFGIKHLLVCINKMDLIGYDQEKYELLVSDFRKFGAGFSFSTIEFIPISALLGDNVAIKSASMPWYTGQPLLHYLDTIEVEVAGLNSAPRLPIQIVIRPQSAEHPDFRACAGQVDGGEFSVGDEIAIWPSGTQSIIREIYLAQQSIPKASTGQSVSVVLADDIDAGRGELIAPISWPPMVSSSLKLMICWLDRMPMRTESRYIIKHGTRETKCFLRELLYKVEINTLSEVDNGQPFTTNDIGCIRIATATPLAYDYYSINRNTGSIILIDEQTNNTVAAGMIVEL